MKKTLLVMTLVLSIFLSGCFYQDEAGDPVNPNFGGSISLFAYTPDQLNPLTTKYHTNAMALSIVYNSLVKISPDLTITPELAAGWSFSSDGLSCTFTITPDILCHDGSVLTASDVIYSLDLIRSNPESMYYPIFQYLESYAASTDYEFTVRLKEPGSTFLSYMDFPVVKKDTTLIGSGPYRLSSMEEDQLVLTANTGIEALISPNIETVTIRFYPKEDMEEFAFLSGETSVFSAEFYQLAQLSAKTNVTKTEYVSDYYTFLGFNTQTELFRDPEMRRAVASLLDKDEMTKTILVNYARPCNSPYKPGTIYGGLFTGDYGYSVEAAYEHMQNAGISAESARFSILVNEESNAKIKTAEFIAEKLMAGGIEASVHAVPFDQYQKELEAGNYTAFIGEITMDQSYDLRFLLQSQNHYFHYENAYLDSVLQRFAWATTPEEKLNAAQEIQNILQTDLPLISLYYRTNVFLANDTISGELLPTQKNSYQNIAKWIAIGN